MASLDHVSLSSFTSQVPLVDPLWRDYLAKYIPMLAIRPLLLIVKVKVARCKAVLTTNHCPSARPSVKHLPASTVTDLVKQCSSARAPFTAHPTYGSFCITLTHGYEWTADVGSKFWHSAIFGQAGVTHRPFLFLLSTIVRLRVASTFE